MAVPFVTIATVLEMAVYRCARSGSASMTLHTLATPGV
jgi:hypothetical protein